LKKQLQAQGQKEIRTDPKIALGTQNQSEEEEFEDETDEELTFEQRKYGVYLDDEVRIVLDKRVSDTSVVEGRYLSMHDDMVAIATKDDKTQWIAIDYIVSITCLFHRKPIPAEKMAEKKQEEHMFG